MLKIREAYFPETLADPHGPLFLSLTGNDNGRFSLVQKALTVLQRSHFRHAQAHVQAELNHEPIADQRESSFLKAALLDSPAVFPQNSGLFHAEAFAFVNAPQGFITFMWGWFMIHQFDEPIENVHGRGK